MSIYKGQPIVTARPSLSMQMGGPSNYLDQRMVLAPKISRSVNPCYSALERLKKQRGKHHAFK